MTTPAKKSLVRIAVSLCGLIVVILVGDRLAGYILANLFDDSQNMKICKLNHIAKTADEDVIFLGSSKTEAAVIPDVISDTLGMTVFNGGVASSGFIYSHFIALNLLLSHHTPKIIILEIRPDEFKNTSHLGYDLYAPYLGTHAKVDSIFFDIKKDWGYKLSHSYRYNPLIPDIFSAFFSDNEDLMKRKGHLTKPTNPKLKSLRIDSLKPNGSYDSHRTDLIDEFISLCKSKHIQLFFLTIPGYSHEDPALYNHIRQVARRENLKIFEFYDREILTDNPELFWDKKHLSSAGAKIFSKMLAHELREYLDSARSVRTTPK